MALKPCLFWYIGAMTIRHEDARHYQGVEVVYDRTGEHGVIQSANDTYVFVLYLGDRTAKATRAADLRFAEPTLQECYERMGGIVRSVTIPPPSSGDPA